MRYQGLFATCLITTLYFLSARADALSCIQETNQQAIDRLVEKATVIAVVKTGPDVQTRIMKTTAALRGQAKKDYFYADELINPVPNTCCIEIQPETEFLLLAGEEKSVGYSVCGGNGLRSLESENGWPPIVLIDLYSYLDSKSQGNIIELLSARWPEVQAMWINEYQESLSHSCALKSAKEKLEQKSEHGKSCAQLREEFADILSKWNPKIIEDSLDSPYLSNYQKIEMRNEYYEKKYNTRDTNELVKLRHERGELLDFEYEFYRGQCDIGSGRGREIFSYCSIIE